MGLIPGLTDNDPDFAITLSINTCRPGCASALADYLIREAEKPLSHNRLRALYEGYLVFPLKTALAVRALGIPLSLDTRDQIEMLLNKASLSSHERLRLIGGHISLADVLSMSLPQRID